MTAGRKNTVASHPIETYYPAIHDGGAKNFSLLVQVNPIGGRAKKEETVTFLPMEAVSTNGLIDGTRIGRRANYPDSLTEFQRSDVILAKITPCFENGKGAYLESLQTGKGIGSTEFHVFRPDRDLLLPRFLYYLITNGDFRNYAIAFMEGSAGQKRVTTPFVSNCKFPLPSLSEQHRIAAFLDQKTAEIDEAITKKQRLIDLLKEQKVILINQAVTKGLNPNVPMRDSGVEWLGEVPAHWEVKRLKWVTRLQRGYDLPAEQRVPEPFLVVSSGGIIGTHYKARSNGPGVVMGRCGSTDAVFFVEPDFWPHNTALFVSDFQGNRPSWCYFMLRTISKADHSDKSAVPGINRKDIFEIKVAVPPVSEQDTIIKQVENALARLKDAIVAVYRQIELLQEYRTVLIAEVVTGKLDVREDAHREG